MSNKQFFKTKRYIAVDINKVKLNDGLSLNPNAMLLMIQLRILNNFIEKPNVSMCPNFERTCFFSIKKPKK